MDVPIPRTRRATVAAERGIDVNFLRATIACHSVLQTSLDLNTEQPSIRVSTANRRASRHTNPQTLARVRRRPACDNSIVSIMPELPDIALYLHALERKRSRPPRRRDPSGESVPASLCRPAAFECHGSSHHRIAPAGQTDRVRARWRRLPGLPSHDRWPFPMAAARRRRFPGKSGCWRSISSTAR